MCGIFCSVTRRRRIKDSFIDESTLQLLKNRGPDSGLICRKKTLICGGFVLWHQGDFICKQPVENELCLFLFNGDGFHTVPQKPGAISDTKWTLEQLSATKSDSEIICFLQTMEGPYAFIFYNKINHDLYFARDSLGRNSLLLEANSEEWRLTSSTGIFHAAGSVCIELPALGLYKVNVERMDCLKIYPWKMPEKTWHRRLEEVTGVLDLKLSMGERIDPKWLLRSESPCSAYNFYHLIEDAQTAMNALFPQLLQNHNLRLNLKNFSTLLERSVGDRVNKTTKSCSSCLKSLSTACSHAKTGILFSGGVDCIILAVIAHKYVDEKEPIDLINVAFEPIKAATNNWNVPDRLSAKDSYQELRQLCPTRLWNLIEVNVLRTELNEHMEKHIKHLIYPLKTVLDESLGGALWFAARGIGLCDGAACISNARVLLTGSGADELFGGYTRHRNAYERCKSADEYVREQSVLAELEEDWNRFPYRNLGRDDRVVADNGKTLRAPFIEEHIVQFARSLSASQRCCFKLPQGLGDKLFLRLYAYTLGLRFATQLKKRAIQFGSRIANKKENANDISKFF